MTGLDKSDLCDLFMPFSSHHMTLHRKPDSRPAVEGVNAVGTQRLLHEDLRSLSFPLSLTDYYIWKCQLAWSLASIPSQLHNQKSQCPCDTANAKLAQLSRPRSFRPTASDGSILQLTSYSPDLFLQPQAPEDTDFHRSRNCARLRNRYATY